VRGAVDAIAGTRGPGSLDRVCVAHAVVEQMRSVGAAKPLSCKDKRNPGR